MRYIDTGSRDPKDALGSWLGVVLLGAAPVAALRVQTGFFGSNSLGYFEDALQALSLSDGQTRFLIGSNDGLTPRSAVADLLMIAGQPRAGLRVGVVSFQTGFFHPKVFHFQRADGSSTAYVGSANLTGSGTTSLHVEAGMILDTAQGDPGAVLRSIADAIDAWFDTSIPGLYEVSTVSDLDPLVNAAVLGVPAPPRPKRPAQPAKGSGSTLPQGHSLKPLVAMPVIQTPLTPQPQGAPAAPTGSTQAPPMPIAVAASTSHPATPTPPAPSAAVKHWGKTLSDSDAQRKAQGNQRGAITLIQGDYRSQIDQTVYFRNDLFGQQTWTPGTTNTGQTIETTTVPMNVTINGTYHGVLDFKITNGSNRESTQNNYTAELHVEPVTPIIRQTNVANMHLDIVLDSSGAYWLTIS